VGLLESMRGFRRGYPRITRAEMQRPLMGLCRTVILTVFHVASPAHVRTRSQESIADALASSSQPSIAASADNSLQKTSSVQ
jgi:hypothetical protein